METRSQNPPAAVVGTFTAGAEATALALRNNRTSARHVRAFLSGRLKSTVGYLTAPQAVPSSHYTIRTWTGEFLLRIDRMTLANNRGAFNGGWSHPPSIVYFTGTDERGRRWHGRSPGVGMFARLHRNKGEAKRPRPVSRAALRRTLAALVDGLRVDNRIGSDGPLALANHANPFAVPAFASAVALLYKAPRR